MERRRADIVLSLPPLENAMALLLLIRQSAVSADTTSNMKSTSSARGEPDEQPAAIARPATASTEHAHGRRRFRRPMPFSPVHHTAQCSLAHANAISAALATRFQSRQC
jgi:hypothetical protein